MSTVRREVASGGGRAKHSAWRAHENARDQALSPKPFELNVGQLVRP